MFDGDEFFAQFLRQFGVRRKVHTMLLENLLVNESLQQVIDIVAAEMGVSVGGEDLVDVAFAGGDEL